MALLHVGNTHQQHQQSAASETRYTAPRLREKAGQFAQGAPFARCNHQCGEQQQLRSWSSPVSMWLGRRAGLLMLPEVRAQHQQGLVHLAAAGAFVAFAAAVHV